MSERLSGLHTCCLGSPFTEAAQAWVPSTLQTKTKTKTKQPAKLKKKNLLKGSELRVTQVF